MSQPNLLKPSDLTKPLLKSPSNYYRNETKQSGCYSFVDEQNSPYMQLASTTRNIEGIVHKDSHGSVQAVMPDYHTIDGVINPNDKTSVEPCGIESADQKDVLDGKIPKLQLNSEECCEVVLPPHDILKQLILPDSKMKQNEKLLKEFRERHFQMEKSCISENTETGANLLLHNETNHNDESAQDCSSPTPTIFAVNENIDQSHGDEIIPNGCNDPLNDVNRTDFSQPTRQESDTTNDAAIAAALQEELKQNEEHASKQSDSCKPDATPHCNKILHGRNDEDYKLACLVQKGYDEEMAGIIQTQESEGQSYYTNPRQNYPSYPVQGYLLQSRRNDDCLRFNQRSNRELDRERRLRYLEQRDKRFCETPSVARSDSIGLTYEELYELKDVPYGFDVSTIQRHTSMFCFTKEISRPSSNQSDHKQCLICLTPYELDDMLRLLPCMHSFHRECIDTWLSERRTCPVCLSDLITDNNK